MQRYKSTYTGPQMDVAFERALPGGAIDQSMSAKLDWEGLINPEFTVAQAGIGGNHGSVPYAADCWKLISGTVSAAPGGGLVLNGVIRQTREKAVGLDVVASINVTSGTATATYDDAAKYFEITSSGGTIKRAHLGLIAITDWSKIPPADCGDELRKCQRYFQRLSGDSTWSCIGFSATDGSTNATLFILLVTPMRSKPVITFTNLTIGGVPITSIEPDQYNPTILKYKAILPSQVVPGMYPILQGGSGYVDAFADL